MKGTKFNNPIVCVLLRMPLKRETATVTALIPGVLTSGCAKYPTVSAMTAATEEMYGSVFDAQIIKKGEEQILQFAMDRIEPVTHAQVLEYLTEVILNPLLENGVFAAKNVEHEKTLLKLGIQSRMNNKGEYAKLRCIEEMCKGEAFGVYADGYLEDIDAITPADVYARYKEILETAAVEMIMTGDEDG